MQMKVKNKNIAHNSEYVLFGLFVRELNPKTNVWRLKPNYKRIAFAFVVFVALFWCACSITVYSFFKYVRGYEKMSIVDAFCVPFNIDKHRKNLGEFNIEKSKEFFKQKRFSDGFMALTSGVYRSPNNLEARKLLATIHMYSLKNSEYASAILEQKLAEAFVAKDIQYIMLAIAFFSQNATYNKKSVLLIEKAMTQNIITNAEICKILSNVNSMFSKTDVAWFEEYFKQIAQSKFVSAKVKEFSAKILATHYLRKSDVAKAVDILSENGVNSGSVFEQVKVFNMYENGNELDALEYARNLLKKDNTVYLVYDFLVKVHNDFGNDIEARSAQRMAILTSPDLRDSKMMSIIENNDVSAIEALAENANASTLILKAMKLSMKFKNKKMLLACLSAIKKITSPDVADLTLVYAETSLRMGAIEGIEDVLLELKSKNKSLKHESLIDDLLFVNAILNNVATEKQFSAFKEKINQIKKYPM